jgi:hypothetical protein
VHVRCLCACCFPLVLQDVIEKYNVPYQHIIVDDEVDFEEQVKMFAGTGVLISVHGAGLMNQIFMPPGSVTIEIFPNHVKHVLYERVAHYSGVYHFKVPCSHRMPQSIVDTIGVFHSSRRPASLLSCQSTVFLPTAFVLSTECRCLPGSTPRTSQSTMRRTTVTTATTC